MHAPQLLRSLARRTSFAAAALGAVALAGTVSLAAFLPRASQDVPEPAPEHQKLTEMVGTWEGTLTMAMEGAPEGAMVMPAREVVEAVGPFWTRARFECDMGPQSYRGEGHMGYDPERGLHLGTWVDNMSPYLALMEGEFDEDANTLHMRWQAPDMEGEMQSHRFEAVYSDGRYTSTFYQGEGRGTKIMTIEMRRQK